MSKNPPSQTDIATEAVTGVPVDTGRSVDRDIPDLFSLESPDEEEETFPTTREGWRTTKWTREDALVLACCVALLAIGTVGFWELAKALFRWIS